MTSAHCVMDMCGALNSLSRYEMILKVRNATLNYLLSISFWRLCFGPTLFVHCPTICCSSSMKATIWVPTVLQNIILKLLVRYDHLPAVLWLVFFFCKFVCDIIYTCIHDPESVPLKPLPVRGTKIEVCVWDIIFRIYGICHLFIQLF